MCAALQVKSYEADFTYCVFEQCGDDLHHSGHFNTLTEFCLLVSTKYMCPNLHLKNV